MEAHVLQHQICTEQADFDLDVVAGERMYDHVCRMIDNLQSKVNPTVVQQKTWYSTRPHLLVNFKFFPPRKLTTGC